MSKLFTIGHSAHAFEEFAALLKQHEIEVVADVRSAPYSKFAPQFDRDLIQGELAKGGVRYLFLGDQLGGRPKSSAYYDADGHVLYSSMIRDAQFVSGIERLERGIANYRVAIMCGEEDPAHCHRRLLVGRVMSERGHELQHIRGDGAINTDADVARESRKPLVNEQPALFAELDEDQWRSTASVLPRRTPSSFSEH
jgi:uncharacterized protein (DUF488 family)